ncbi:MAG: hypothetical protein U0792_23335 [Gemmataceae bacterium]
MSGCWLQGVVKNGQVVLETPLDLPDGTVVTVMDYDPADDPRPRGPTGPFTDDEILRILGDYSGRPDLIAELLRDRQHREAV